MRRALCTVLIIVILIMGVCHAESARTSDDELFISAIELLKQTKNRQSLADAQEMLESIESNYNMADMFAAYASILVDLHDEKLEDAQIKLDILSRNQTFIDLLSEYELPGCDVVAEYIKARLAESDGHYDEALELYTSISFFDSLARSFDLVGREKQQAYEAACDLFDKGMFVEAAEAFEALGQYKDSVERAEESRARVTPEPTPTSSPTSVPEPVPTSESYQINISRKAIRDFDHTILIISNGDSRIFEDGSIENELSLYIVDNYSTSVYGAGSYNSKEINKNIPEIIAYESTITAIIVLGYNWWEITDAIDYCTSIDMPIWVTNQTDIDALKAEIDVLFN